MKTALLAIAALSSLGVSVRAQTTPSVIGLDTLLRQETDLSQLPTLHDWTSNLQSSYDRTGGNGDSGQYLSGDGKDGVLADMDGPGAVVRIWSANPGGEIKVFIDNAPTPVIDTAFSHLFDGSYAPFKAPLCAPSSGGFYSYLPIPYAHHCHIELIGGGGTYYHVNYLTFAKNTQTTSFTLPLSPGDQAAVDAANAAWAGVATPKLSTVQAASDSKTAPSGKTLTVANYKGPGVIRHLALSLPKATDADLRRLVLRGYFDGHKTPDVEAPIADFFGNAFGHKPFRTLLLGQAADGSFEADFPMPFARSARWTLENGSGAAQPINWSADFVKAPFHAADTGYFHAVFFQETTKPKIAHTWTKVTGQRGRFVGIVQTMAGTSGLGFLEGDDQFRSDAQTWLPSQDANTVVGPWNGTGTEDCFNSGWYFNAGPNSLPVNALLLKDDGHGRINCLRWFLNDAPTFQNSLDAQIEHGGDNGDGDGTYYSSVAYWYATGPTQPWSVLPAASALALPAPPPPLFSVPHGLEGEYLNAVASGGGAGSQAMLNFGRLWSNNTQLFWNQTTIGDTLTLTLPAQKAGTYDLVGYFTKAGDYGQVSFTLNGKLLPATFDGFNAGVIPSGPIDLGVVTLPDGPSKLVVTVTGKNAAASGTLFGLDALALNPVGSVPAPLPKIEAK